MVQGALTVDVEDYFQVAAFERQCPSSSWNTFPCRVETNTERLLELLSDNGTKATFFVLGWVAKRYPQLIRRIVEEGHELASHGYLHQRIYQLDQAQFRQDIREAKSTLEDIVGLAVIGYRAPSFSISAKTPWASDELIEAGYRYSSSINPVPHDLYGFQDACPRPFHWPNGLLELPVTTYQLFGRRIPCAGGGYFRLYPYALSKQLLKEASKQLDGKVIFYLHPWEVDPDQPIIDGASLKSRFRHYLNLKRTYPRLQQLLNDFSWAPLADQPHIKSLLLS